MSEIRATTISDTAGTGPITLTKQSAAKVFCSVTYSGGTPITSQSINISSLTDIGNGFVQYNYSTNFDNSVYSIVLGGNDNNYGNRAAWRSAEISSSSVRTVFIEGNSTTVEDDRICVVMHGDLA